MFNIDLITFLASIGVTNGIIISIYFWFRKDSTDSHKVLSLLLFVTSLRIIKNIIVHMRIIDPSLKVEAKVWELLINLGISQQFAIGPLFLFYFKSFLTNSFRIDKSLLYHLLLYLLFIPASFFIKWAFWNNGGLWFTYLHVLLYYVLTFKLFYKKKLDYDIDSIIISWLEKLIIFAGILIIAYSPILFKYLGYVGGAVFYAIGLFFVIITVLREKKLNMKKRYQSSLFTTEEKEKLVIQLESLMNDRRFYRNSKLKLQDIADALQVTINKVSRLINEDLKKSFNDYVNTFRVEEVKSRLLNNKNNDTISTMAYDAGFESISSFNTAFKNIVSKSPSEFRKKNLKNLPES